VQAQRPVENQPEHQLHAGDDAAARRTAHEQRKTSEFLEQLTQQNERHAARGGHAPVRPAAPEELQQAVSHRARAKKKGSLFEFFHLQHPG